MPHMANCQVVREMVGRREEFGGEGGRKEWEGGREEGRKEGKGGRKEWEGGGGGREGGC